MANHKSAQKRSRQSITKSQINSQILSKIKTKINNFNEILISKNKADLDKSLSLINSSLSKAVKNGLIKKEFVSRKLSLLSKKIKDI